MLYLKLKKQHIMENENDFYSSDDLFSESSFTCEFDENEWKQAFRSTVVMPIRMKLFRSERVKYAVIGLLCVDANLPNPSWKSYEFEDSIGHFHLSAFCSAIYTLLDVRKERVSYVKKRLHDYKQSQMEESV